MSLRILVVDDHDVVRQGVRLILRGAADWKICGEASNGSDAVVMAADLKPDLMILDISMPGKDGLDVARELRTRGNGPKILILTMHHSGELSGTLKTIGVRGYVTKSHAARDLIPAIQALVDGQEFFPANPSNDSLFDSRSTRP